MDFLFPYIASIFLFIQLVLILYFDKKEREAWSKERQLLLDRIMARDVNEFHALNDAPQDNKVEDEPDPNILDIGDPQMRAQIEGSEED